MQNEIEKFIKDCNYRGLADNTQIAYEIHLRHYLSYLDYKKINYAEIKTKDLKKYTQAAKNTGDSASTINSRLSAITEFYNYKLEENEVEHNPINRRLYTKNKKTTKMKALTDTEKNTVLAWADNKDQHIRLGFYTLFYTGLRISELCNLKKKDIQTLDNRVVIHVLRQKRKNEGYVPVFNALVAEQLLRYAQEQITEPLFKVKPRTFQYHAQKCKKQTGIDFTIHQTRHTFATNRLTEGMRLDILQKIMGHKHISTTMLYANTLNKDVILAAPTIPTLKEKNNKE